jgi:hypothetical protein
LNSWGTLKRCLGDLELEYENYLLSTAVNATQRGLRLGIEQHARLRTAQDSSCASAKPSSSEVSLRDLLFGLQTLTITLLVLPVPDSRPFAGSDSYNTRRWTSIG